MSINDGQVEVHPLSDEALLARMEAEEGQVEDTQPQKDDTATVEESGAEAGEGAPAGTSPEPEADATTPEAEPEAQAEPETQAEPEDKAAATEETELEKLRKQYNDLRAWSTRLSMENSRLRQQTEATPAPPEKAAEAEPKSPQDFLKDLVNNGEQGFNAAVDRRAREIAQELVAPLLAEREQERLKEYYRVAFNEATDNWKQLNTEEGKSAMIHRMVEMASEDGRPDGWLHEPDRYIFRACKELWGYPKVVDTDAIEAARRMEREAVVREYAEKQAKSGLATHPAANKDNSQNEKTPEELVKEEMRDSWYSGVF